MKFPLSELFTYLILLGSVIGVIAGFRKYIKKHLTRWLMEELMINKLVEAHASIKQTLHLQNVDNRRVMETVDKIYQQLTVNGGTVTVKDDLSVIKNQIHSMISLSSDPTFINDAAGACIEANDSLCTLFGASRESLLGFGWVNFLIDSEKNQKRENWINAIKNDNYIKDNYHVIKGDTGEIIHCEYSASISRSKGVVQNIIGKVKVLNDGKS